MSTQILTGEDIRFLAQQPEYEVDVMVGQMTTLMQNITDLQNDTDDKVKTLESQNLVQAYDKYAVGQEQGN